MEPYPAADHTLSRGWLRAAEGYRAAAEARMWCSVCGLLLADAVAPDEALKRVNAGASRPSNPTEAERSEARRVLAWPSFAFWREELCLLAGLEVTKLCELGRSLRRSGWRAAPGWREQMLAQLGRCEAAHVRAARRQH